MKRFFFILMVLAIFVMVIPASVMAAPDFSAPAVPLTTTTEDVSISITVDVPSLAFHRVGGGNVVVGMDSDIEDIIVTNDLASNAPITLSINLDGGTDDSFYKQFLYFSTGGGYSKACDGGVYWVYDTPIDPGGHVDISALIRGANLPGDYGGSLTFEATQYVSP